MYSGRYLFSVTSDEHVKWALNHLGRYPTTYGNYVHAIEPYVMATPPFGWIVTSINNKRRQEFLKEEAAKKAMATVMSVASAMV